MIHQAMPEKNGHFFEKPIAICTLLWYNNSVERETAGWTSRRGMEDAAADLDNFQSDGWELPKGITAENFAAAMNEILAELSDK